jgi:hypothetical protein
MPSLLVDRLSRQGLDPVRHSTPEAAVGWLGAVQAQDYQGAAWALALRVRRLTLADVDRALADGRILRTHVLRPTWHFATPADLRWMLALTGPRLKRLLATYDARLELTPALYRRARGIIVRALEGGRSMTRNELAVELARGRIVASGQRLAHLVMDAEIGGVICSGPRRGAQMTYALLDERAPATPSLTRDEALAALASRYFQSHGPATAHDFAWWSGLTVTDARKAVALAGVERSLLTTPPSLDRVAGAHYLLPNFDEYLIAYRHRGAVLDPARARNFGVFTSVEFPHQVVLHGRVAGSWRREVDATRATVTLKLYAKPTATELRALTAAARRFGRFQGRPCDVRH